MPSKAVLDAIRDRQAANWTTLAVYYPNDVVSPAADLAAFVQVEFPVGSGGRLTLVRDGGHEEVGDDPLRRPLPDQDGDGFGVHLCGRAGRPVPLRPDFNTATASLETYAPTPPAGLGADVAYYLVSVVVPYRYLFVP